MKGNVFDIQRWSLHDGPGIRTNVFLKGCPLTCTWCSNPESQISARELVFFRDKCIGCGRCLKACPYGAVTQAEDGGRKVDSAICRRVCYGKDEEADAFVCTRMCYAKALDIMGEWKETEEVLEEVLRDHELYRKNGGGVTVTGGEPFGQAEFLTELLRRCKEEGLHTAVETSGYVSREVLERALPWIDFIFVDMKLWDSDRHRAYTGVDNAVIIENLKFLDTYSRGSRLEIVVRTPVIPEVNDSVSEIRSIAAFIKEQLPYVKTYELLPYHRLGRGKYENLGRVYEMADLVPPSEEKMKQLKAVIREYGLKTAYEGGGRNNE